MFTASCGFDCRSLLFHSLGLSLPSVLFAHLPQSSASVQPLPRDTQTFSIFVVQINKHKYSLQKAPTETVFTVSKQTNFHVAVVVPEYDE